MIDDQYKSVVDEFVLQQIDSVPHLEALLLIWNSRPRNWSAEDMGKALYVRNDVAEQVLEGLVQRGLIERAGNSRDSYAFPAVSAEQTKLMENLDSTYRRELVRVAGIIHSKASTAVLDFARAFRFKKD
jgi:DNA-binding MarR family transcriptional regulator